MPGTLAKHMAPTRDRDRLEQGPLCVVLLLISYRPREALTRFDSQAPYPTTAENGTTIASNSSLPKTTSNTIAADTRDHVCQLVFIKVSVIRWPSGLADARPKLRLNKPLRIQQVIPNA